MARLGRRISTLTLSRSDPVDRVTTRRHLQEAAAAFRKVFAKASATEPFVPRLHARLLLYPIDYTVLDPSQFEAVARASLRAGMSSAYFANYGREDSGWDGTYGHRLVDLHSYADYRFVDGYAPLEHFLFPSSGDWGLVTSDGRYALVAGSEDFISDIRSALELDQRAVIRDFVSEWRDMERAGGSVDWVPLVLKHVSGPDGEAIWQAG